MTTKKTKASKPAYKATQADINLAASAGLNIRAGETAKAAVNKAVKDLHAHGAVIGDARNCPLAQAFLDKRFPDGKGANGKKAAASSKGNALAAFRKAVKSGKDYTENGIREAKRAGKKGANPAGGNVMIVIPRGADVLTACEKIHAGVEKLRSANDQFAALAAYITDALEEAGYTPSAE